MGMRISFYTDEHVARAVVRGLRHRGVDVLTVPEAGLLGAMDEEHVERVHSHSAHQIFNVFWAFSRSGVCVQALELIGWGSQRQSDRPS